MAIPPFPSQEVAKLVLGYLAEEDLMTAYDEFLQASPYLDAFSNEYGRVFMTSLKNILAEYMAIKIYVESCKPITLRRKLMQCSNLLEVIKLLVALVDVQKSNFQDKPRVIKQNVSKVLTSCDICGATNSASCVCNSINANTKTQVSSGADTLDSSVEATSLADLPGNAVVIDDVQKEVSTIVNLKKSESNSSESSEIQRTTELSSNSDLHINSVTSSTPESNASVCLPQSAVLMQSSTDTSRQNIEEFDTILSKVAQENNSTMTLPNSTILNIGTCKNLADATEGTIKDSTHINYSAVCAPDTKSYNKSKQDPTILGLTQETLPASSSDFSTSKESPTLGMLDDKSCEQKIKILSDIKVNNNTYAKMPPIIKSTTNTPLAQMQTLYINGKCAYKNNMQTGKNFNYTKDEIMAMPTIILVPSAGSSSHPQIVTPKSTEIVNMLHSESAKQLSPYIPPVPSVDIENMQTVQKATEVKNADSKTITASKVRTSSIQTSEKGTKVNPKKRATIKPLSIEVKTQSSVADKVSKQLNLESIDNTNNIGLVKTVDNISASLPKEPLGTVLHKTSTPNSAPPIKKSSSTPRRTSHIRVLDFTTPRRILNENSTEINTIENVNHSQQNAITTHIPHCNISSKYVPDQESSKKNLDENMLNQSADKKVKPTKKCNWDADLRALIGQSEVTLIERFEKSKEKITCKENKAEKNIPSVKPHSKKSKVTNSSKRKDKGMMSTKKTKKLKDKSMECNSSQNIVKVSAHVAPLCATNEAPTHDDPNIHSQVNHPIEQSDTPEAERQALQNVIGAKLNISELLETPYKQALYDIQMETPRFLGPDLPDEPMSDIKIMNIPTPRFFDTPKITQATPSSYSSRLTDYSSGGSYYKPDDQDYIPISEVLECAITVCSEEANEKPANKENDPELLHEKPRRPVRTCTKNVSYRKSCSTKTKEDAPSLKDNNIHAENDTKHSKKASAKATPSRKLKSEAVPKIFKDKKESPLKSQKKLKIMSKKIGHDLVSKKNRKLSNDSKQHCVTENQIKKKISKDKVNATMTAVAVPTKSRRKSATPRKLHCTKSFNSDSSELNISNLSKNKEEIVQQSKVLGVQDSDSEQPPLRWSDDGSQDAKSKEALISSSIQTEDEDIDNIKKYIESCAKDECSKDRLSSCKLETKGKFDVETAKIIERDLLDTPPRVAQLQTIDVTGNESNKLEITVISHGKDDGVCDKKESSEELEEEEVELSVRNCDEESDNYFSYVYNESSFVQNDNLCKLKDKFCMELCIEDDISIRLNATAISTVFEQDPGDLVVDESYVKETTTAISSISNIEKLYTPLKSARSQYIDIFDSTLTSLDTPLKKDDAKDTERGPDTQVTEIVLEIESIQCKDKTDGKKRKRSLNVANESGHAKKLKSETQELLKSANIQNIDIESVLSKLHGP